MSQRSNSKPGENPLEAPWPAQMRRGEPEGTQVAGQPPRIPTALGQTVRPRTASAPTPLPPSFPSRPAHQTIVILEEAEEVALAPEMRSVQLDDPWFGEPSAAKKRPPPRTEPRAAEPPPPEARSVQLDHSWFAEKESAEQIKAPPRHDRSIQLDDGWFGEAPESAPPAVPETVQLPTAPELLGSLSMGDSFQRGPELGDIQPKGKDIESRSFYQEIPEPDDESAWNDISTVPGVRQGPSFGALLAAATVGGLVAGLVVVLAGAVALAFVL